MLLVKNRCNDPHFNLALDEYLLTRTEGEYFMLWQNCPSVIIGRNQDALAEINFEFLKENNINLVRRMSGGGAVFHDLGNINFTYITQCEKTDFFNFQRFAAPILQAVSSLGIQAEATGRNDLTAGGRKFSGNAQHLHAGRLLHHGTILFDSDFSYMQGALNVDPAKLKGKGVSSVSSRVVNLRSCLPPGRDMATSEFLEYLEGYILTYFDGCTEYRLTDKDIAAVSGLADEKYRSDGWNLLHLGSYSFKNSRRFPLGQVGVAFDAKGGKLQNVRFFGDFFGEMDISALERGLEGLPHSPAEIESALVRLGCQSYIAGVEANLVAALFF